MPSSQTRLRGFAGINAIWRREYGKYRIDIGPCVQRYVAVHEKRILFIASHKASSYFFIRVALNAEAECRRVSNFEIFGYYSSLKSLGVR